MKALLFDMDGVIVDSNPIHCEAWLAYNRRFGVETTQEMLSKMYGKRNDALIRDYLGQGLTDAEVQAHGAAKEQLYREMMAPRLEEHLVPGLREFLMRYQDIPKAVATNAETANVEFVLGRSGLGPFFRDAVDGQQVANPKPAPDVYLLAAERIGAAPSDCVVFEDSHGGVQAGLAAGMTVIGLRTTHRELPGAALAVDDFLAPELRRWMDDRISWSSV